jgi:hypothetical protein
MFFRVLSQYLGLLFFIAPIFFCFCFFCADFFFFAFIIFFYLHCLCVVLVFLCAGFITGTCVSLCCLYNWYLCCKDYMVINTHCFELNCTEL